MKDLCRLAILAFFIQACQAQSATKVPAVAALPSIAPAPVAESPDEVPDEAYVTCYLVIADTGRNYYALQQKMVGISKKLSVPVNTLGRYYNAAKDLISLPDNDEDELYAGSYFPRREPSESLSLEYLYFYQNTAPEKTIALVRGIYGSEPEAVKALKALQPFIQTAYKIKAQVYMGCMH